MSLLAFDIGSSRCKAVAFSVNGAVLARHSCNYTPKFPAPSRAEMNPEIFWQALRECCGAVCSLLSDPITAVCLSSHGETFVPVNGSNEALGPMILNQDNRATQEALWVEKTLGRSALFKITGLIAHSMYPIPKILWLRKHNPRLFDQPICFITVIGFLLARLGLPAYVDYSLASRYLAFDVVKKCWSKEILAATGISADWLPVPVAAGTIVGELGESAAEQLGLARGTVVVLGGHDQACGALGVGVMGPGRVADSIGTYECLAVASSHPAFTEAAFAASLNTYCHVVPDMFLTLAYFPSGIMMKWFHDLLYGQENHGGDSSEAELLRYSIMEQEASANPSGLCITPNLIGTCNPEFNPHARGIISGLSAGTTRSQIYQGILEGLACEMAQMADILTKALGDFRDVYVTGGGSRSELGLRLRSAMSGRNLHFMQCQESVCLGAAILAGTACGKYSSLRAAVDETVREVSTIFPDAAIAERYAQQRREYARVRAILPMDIPMTSGTD